jgi:lysine-N-methylase
MAIAMNEYLTMRYMKDFKCIGLDCEDTCCSGWSVGIDEDHYKKLKRAIDQTQEQRREFSATHKRVDIKKRSCLHYATLCMREDGYCRLLDADGLCSVQRRFGE